MDDRPVLMTVPEPDGWDRPPRSRTALVRFTGGVWREATITGWRRNGDGWFVRLAWPGSDGDWFAFDAQHMRPGLWPAARVAGRPAAGRPAAHGPAVKRRWRYQEKYGPYRRCRSGRRQSRPVMLPRQDRVPQRQVIAPS